MNAITPYMKEPITFDLTKPDNLLKILAGVTSHSITDYSNHNEFIYIVSHPGSLKLKEFIEFNNCEMKVFIKNLPQFNKSKFYKKWVFRESELSDLSLKEFILLGKLKDEAEKDFMHLKTIGKGKFHGEII